MTKQSAVIEKIATFTAFIRNDGWDGQIATLTPFARNDDVGWADCLLYDPKIKKLLNAIGVFPNWCVISMKSNFINIYKH